MFLSTLHGSTLAITKQQHAPEARILAKELLPHHADKKSPG